jgi:MinD-like ATPase involved in chromosome partitioning or flagellar assembly
MSRIVTFYSYKGGVGRTSILANVAVLLAQRGHRVLAMDWDLEAPGLNRYFKLNDTAGKGLLPFILQAQEHPAEARWCDHLHPITLTPESHVDGGAAHFDYLPSGFGSPGYSEAIQAFSWSHFFQEHEGGQLLDRWRREWLERYDFVLIDSRTGLTDIGGITTVVLPDYLVLVFTANEQSLEGACAIAQSAQAARAAYPLERYPLTVIPVPNRFDGRDEVDQAREWLDTMARATEPFFATWLPTEITTRKALEQIKVPYVASYSFGEKIATLTQGTSDPDSPGYAVAKLAGLIGGHLVGAAAVLRNGDRLHQSGSPGCGLSEAMLARLNAMTSHQFRKLIPYFGFDDSELNEHEYVSREVEIEILRSQALVFGLDVRCAKFLDHSQPKSDTRQ